MTYYKTGRIYREDGDYEWNKGTVSKLLTNVVYTGTLVQGVKQQNLAKGVKQHYVNAEEHIVAENAHEPIISKEDYEKLQRIRKERKANHYFSYPVHDFEREYENRFKNLVINNKTGKPLFRRTRIYGKNHDRLCYLFQNDIYNGSINPETKVLVMERDLDKAISEKISEFLTVATNEKIFTDRIVHRFNKSIDVSKKVISKLHLKIEKEEIKIQKAYEEYSLGKSNRDKYSLKREVALGHIGTIKSEIIAMEQRISEKEDAKKKALEWIEDVFKSKGLEQLPGELIQRLVEKIVVYGKHNFEVVFKFKISDFEGGAK